MATNEEILTEYENKIRESQIQTNQASVGMQQQDIMLQDREKGMLTEQLDLGEVLDRLHNLLRGHVLKRDENGEFKWSAPENKDLIVLSDYGISYIMQMLQAYLTKNTLLSNYDDKQINEKMEDFSTTLADAVFMEYDKMFQYPTLEEVKGEITKRIKAKVDIRKFATELIGNIADEKEIEKIVIKEMESRIEREMEVIKEQKMKNKLKRFESLVRMVQDTVHSAYQRAWKGQERTTLRQHIHISENKGGGFQVPQDKISMNPFTGFRKK